MNTSGLKRLVFAEPTEKELREHRIMVERIEREARKQIKIDGKRRFYCTSCCSVYLFPTNDTLCPNCGGGGGHSIDKEQS